MLASMGVRVNIYIALQYHRHKVVGFVDKKRAGVEGPVSHAAILNLPQSTSSEMIL